MKLSRISTGPRRVRRGRVIVPLAALSLIGAALLAFGPRGTAQETATNTTAAAKTVPGSARLTAPLSVSWKFTGTISPNNPAAPVIGDGVAYIADGNRLYAINLSNGSLKWRYPTDATLSSTILTTPALSNGVLYFGASDGLYALDVATNKVKWHYFVRSAVNTSPQVVGNTIYFSTDSGRFYAVNTQTGDALKGIWSQGNKPGVEIGADMSADFAVANDMIYYITSDEVIHAVSLTAGTQRWAQRLDGETRIAPVVNGESVYVVSGNTFGAIRLSSGQRRWSVTLNTGVAAPPAVDEDGISYVVTSDRMVYAVDGRGRAVWKQAPRLDYEVIAAPVLSGNLLVIGTAQGGLYAFDKATGALKWSYVVHPSGIDGDNVPTSTNVSANTAVAGDTLYVLTDDGTLTAFKHDAPDDLPPTVTVLEPTPGDYISGRPPLRIAARIWDDGSGLNLDTLTIKLDDTLLPRRPALTGDDTDRPGYYYDPDDDSIEYYTPENSEAGLSNALPDGHHTVTIVAKDWKGNTVTKSWMFSTDDTIKPRSKRRTNRTGGRPGGGAPGGGGVPGGGGGKGGGGR